MHKLVITLGLLCLINMQSVVGLPDSTQWHNLIRNGDEYLKSGQMAMALNAYRQALHLKPDSSEAHQRLGNLLSLSGNFENAINENRCAIELDPANALAHANLGWLLGVEGKYSESAYEERLAIWLAPNNSLFYFTLGLALANSGDYDGAITALHKAIALDQNNVRAYLNLGSTLGRAGRYPEAISAYQQAIKLDPKLLSAHLGMAAAFAKTGKIVEQIKQLCIAIQIDPQNDSAHGRLGWVLLERGNWAAALKEGIIASGLRLRHYGPAYLSMLFTDWTALFLLFGLIFAVLIFGCRFNPIENEVVLKSFFLVFYEDKPGRLSITNKRLVFVPESISRWFGAKLVDINRDIIEIIASKEKPNNGLLIIKLKSGTSFVLTMPIFVYRPLIQCLAQTAIPLTTQNDIRV